MSIQLLFCCICSSQRLENGLAASWAIAAADCSRSPDVCVSLVVVACVCAKLAFAAHANARTTTRIVVTFCRVISNLPFVVRHEPFGHDPRDDPSPVRIEVGTDACRLQQRQR